MMRGQGLDFTFIEGIFYSTDQHDERKHKINCNLQHHNTDSIFSKDFLKFLESVKVFSYCMLQHCNCSCIFLETSTYKCNQASLRKIKKISVKGTWGSLGLSRCWSLFSEFLGSSLLWAFLACTELLKRQQSSLRKPNRLSSVSPESETRQMATARAAAILGSGVLSTLLGIWFRNSSKDSRVQSQQQQLSRVKVFSSRCADARWKEGPCYWILAGSQ